PLKRIVILRRNDEGSATLCERAQRSGSARTRLSGDRMERARRRGSCVLPSAAGGPYTHPSLLLARRAAFFVQWRWFLSTFPNFCLPASARSGSSTFPNPWLIPAVTCISAARSAATHG